MQSRRDQVQAHLFVMSRVAAGVLRAEPDAPDTPVGRTNRGAAIGLAVALLIGAGAGVYGLIKPGGATGWKQPGTLVVVKESGARYVFAGGLLHPVLNEASARLLAGDQLKVDQVSARSLDGAPRGTPVGIVGAPDGLPAPAAAAGADWLLCTMRTATAGTAAAKAAPQLSVAIGTRQTGRPAGEQGVLVTGPDGAVHLLWHGRRFAVDAAGGAARALGWSAAVPVPVTASFLAAFPAGPELRAPEVPGRGKDGPVLSGRPTKVGQLFTGTGEERYVLAEQGLVAVTATQFALLQGEPRTQQEAYGNGQVAPAPAGAADLVAHTAPASAAAAFAPEGLPGRPPALLPPRAEQALCAALRPAADGGDLDVAVLDASPVLGLPPVLQPGVLPSCTPADRIAVRPGGGALVRAVSGAGFGGTLYLVTDTGVKYPLASSAVAERLGYPKAAPTAVPGRVLSLLPTGPSLDPGPLAGGIVQPAAGGEGRCTR
ncbi:type VII secretion protein EccB [Kitasatospora purpeofusca]|uniref:type VII secretion protein EccB n=1 Tax=Kitasatospora purpeofusca TaxID=67352 RepID=UPI0004C07FE8|nr:type VII secretion protein EccB [Kitasatospora purpeofusca]